MKNITCPSCKAPVDVDHGRKAGRGQLRLVCGECGHRFAVQVQKKDLRFVGSTPRRGPKRSD